MLDMPTLFLTLSMMMDLQDAKSRVVQLSDAPTPPPVPSLVCSDQDNPQAKKNAWQKYEEEMLLYRKESLPEFEAILRKTEPVRIKELRDANNLVAFLFDEINK